MKIDIRWSGRYFYRVKRRKTELFFWRNWFCFSMREKWYTMNRKRVIVPFFTRFVGSNYLETIIAWNNLADLSPSQISWLLPACSPWSWGWLRTRSDPANQPTTRAGYTWKIERKCKQHPGLFTILQSVVKPSSLYNLFFLKKDKRIVKSFFKNN